MSNVSKGKSYEKEVEQILLAENYMVERAFNKTVWLSAGRCISVAHDFFGCWDLIAKKVNEPTLWVQVTTWEQSSAKRPRLEAYKWDSDFDCPVIFARMRNQRPPHFRLLYGRDGYKWEGAVKMIVKKEKENAA